MRRRRLERCDDPRAGRDAELPDRGAREVRDEREPAVEHDADDAPDRLDPYDLGVEVVPRAAAHRLTRDDDVRRGDQEEREAIALWREIRHLDDVTRDVQPGHIVAALGDMRGEDRLDADEERHLRIDGSAEHRLRRRALANLAVDDDGDAIPQARGLVAVVRDENGGRAGVCQESAGVREYRLA